MARPADVFDLSELLAQLARSGLEACCARGLAFLFDHEGLHAMVRGPQERLAALVSATMARAIHLTRGGHVFFGADVHAGQVGECHLVLQWALSEPRLEFLHEWSALGDMEGVPWERPTAGGAGGAQLSIANCPRTGAQLTVLSFGASGAVVRLEVDLPWVGPAGAWADARGARAWLIADAQAAARSEVLARRLQRLGWHTVGYASPAQALADLQQRPPQFAPPALVVNMVEDDASLRSLDDLAHGLPPPAVVLHASVPGAAPAGSAAVTSCTLPLGLGELLALTEGAAGMTQAPSGKTVPTPLSLSQRRRVLLVIANPVEQALATAMLHTLGYEVAVSDTPEEAMAHCERSAPTVLMVDVSASGAGLAMVREVRRRQQDGRLPAFGVVAATPHPALRDAALAAGAGAVVSKPLDRTDLGSKLASTESRC